jgi:predicted DNA repair protein MutK
MATHPPFVMSYDISAKVQSIFALFAMALTDHHNRFAEFVGSSRRLSGAHSEMGVMDAVKMVGGAVIGIAVVTLVVNEVLTVDSINNTSGPFTDVITSLETTGVAAMTLLVIGLLVVAASYIMRYMEGF